MSQQVLDMRGMTKWFGDVNGYKSIMLDGGIGNVFVDVFAIAHAGLQTRQEGQKLGFAIQRGQYGKL